MSELNPQEMVDIITLDRIAEVLQLRNTADPDDARAEVIDDLHRVRNMLVHSSNMPQVNGPTVALTGANAAIATFAAAANQSYGFRLTVKDPFGLMASASTTVTATTTAARPSLAGSVTISSRRLRAPLMVKPWS